MYNKTQSISILAIALGLILMMFGCDNNTFYTPVERPEFSPTPGEFFLHTEVTIIAPTVGSKIKYTDNGQDPKDYGQEYDNQPIFIDEDTLLRAYCYDPSQAQPDSSVVDAQYVIEEVATPTFAPEEGSYINIVNVTLNCSTSAEQDNVVIKYRMGLGTVPNPTPDDPEAMVYDGTSIEVTNTKTIKAIAYQQGEETYPSDVAVGTFSIDKPEIKVETSTGIEVLSASSIDFLAYASGSPLEATFTIRNIGNADLTLTGNPNLVSISGTDVGVFIVSQQPSSDTIPVGGQDNFTIQLTDPAMVDRSIQISIPNNDTDESNMAFNLVIDVAPEIVIKRNSNTIIDGSILNFDDISSGSPPQVIFTIQNNGDGDLHLTGNPLVEFSGTGHDDFTVTQPLSSTIPPTGSETFTIQQIDTSQVSRDILVSIANDDSDENPYTFNLITLAIFTITTNISGGGSITLSPPGEIYEEDTLVTLEGFPDLNWVFDSWSGDLSGDINPTSIVMDDNKSIIAKFNNTNWNITHTLTGHTAPVTSVAINHDGTQIISGSNDFDLRVWEFNGSTWNNNHTLDNHNERVYSVAFNHDGTKIVSGGGFISDFDLRVWDWNSGASTWHMTLLDNGHTDSVTSVAFNHDGTQIVSGGLDDRVKIWEYNGSTWDNNHTLNDHTGAVNSAAFNHDGTQIVSGSNDNNIIIWEYNGSIWDKIHTLTDHSNSVRSVSFNHDGTQIVSGSNDTDIIIWEYNGSIWDKIHTLTDHSNSVTSVAFNHNSSMIVTGCSDNKVRVWE